MDSSVVVGNRRNSVSGSSVEILRLDRKDFNSFITSDPYFFCTSSNFTNFPCMAEILTISSHAFLRDIISISRSLVSAVTVITIVSSYFSSSTSLISTSSCCSLCVTVCDSIHSFILSSNFLSKSCCFSHNSFLMSSGLIIRMS